MRLSDQGAQFIGRFEGFRAELYDDPAGHCTIGYGHLVHRGKCDGSEPAEFKKGITKKRALKLLQEDAASAAAAVEAKVTVPLNQQQFDALVSFVFNLGVGNFSSSTLLKVLNKKKYDEVPEQLDRWVLAGGKRLQGLVNRRKAEGVLFTTGDYGNA
jgi:GH24 family phage-related lysozyme (muramidase)